MPAFAHRTAYGLLQLAPFGHIWLPGPHCRHPASIDPCACWTAVDSTGDDENHTGEPEADHLHDGDTPPDDPGYRWPDDDTDEDDEDEWDDFWDDEDDEGVWQVDLNDAVGAAIAAGDGIPVFWVRHPDCPENDHDCFKCRPVNIASWVDQLNDQATAQAVAAVEELLIDTVTHLTSAENAHDGIVDGRTCAGCIAGAAPHRDLLRHVVVETATNLTHLRQHQTRASTGTTQPDTGDTGTNQARHQPKPGSDATRAAAQQEAERPTRP